MQRYGYTFNKLTAVGRTKSSIGEDQPSAYCSVKHSNSSSDDQAGRCARCGVAPMQRSVILIISFYHFRHFNSPLFSRILLSECWRERRITGMRIIETNWPVENCQRISCGEI